MRGSWRPNRTATYWPPHSYGHQRFFPVLQGCSTGGPGAQLSARCCFLYRIISPTLLIPKLTDFLSSPSYIIVQSPTQYLPITGHRNVSFPPSLEWHVWSSSSGNNCHAVHRSLSSGASVCDGNYSRTAVALSGAASWTCSILLAAFLCSCHQAFSPAV